MAEISPKYRVYIVPSVVEGSALTLVVQEEATLNKYVKELDEKFLDSLQYAAHPFFTKKHTLLIIQSIIPFITDESHGVFLDCSESCSPQHEAGDKPLSIRRENDTTITVSIVTETELRGIHISDILFVECKLVEEKDETKKIRKLEAELADSRRQLVTCLALARDVAMLKMYQDTIAIFGTNSIPPMLYEFSKKVFAAELDGHPYIFECIRPDYINGNEIEREFPSHRRFSPYWLRSVVCLISTAMPVWCKIDTINCRRLVIIFEDSDGADSRTMFGANSRPRPNHLLVLNPTVKSIVFPRWRDSDRTFRPKTEIARACWLFSHVIDEIEIILPSDIKYCFAGGNRMINARFLDTTERALDSPTTYEADGLKKYLAEAKESTKGLVIPSML
jgi:hypothetical protein